MKKILSYLEKIMTDETNSPSAKRYFALAGFIVAIVLAFVGKDLGYVLTFLGFTGTCLGLTTFDKFSITKWIK